MMSTNNPKVQLSQTPTEKPKLIYTKPQIVHLGSLEKVQANYGGSAYDGPSQASYYQ